MKRAWGWLLAVLALLALVAGLSLAVHWPDRYRFVDAGPTARGSGAEATPSAGQPVGQTFVARHAGLAGLEFYLLPEGKGPVALTMHLRTEPGAIEDVATSTLQVPADAQAGFYRFAFPALKESHGRYYYAFLETDDPDPGIAVALVKGTAYQDGAAYQAHTPLDAQTAFRLVYAPQQILQDLLLRAASWPGLLMISGLLFVVPGWALLAWLWPGRRLRWAEMLGLAVGVSLALYPLLLLWTDLVGLRLGPLYAWLPPVAGLVALAWRFRNWRPRQGRETLARWAHSKALWSDLILLLTLVLVFAVRLLVVQTLAVPMWGDSYQHTMIAQLLADNGGLFDSWQPYVPLTSFTYHFGFHTAVTLYHWLTGTDIIRSVIVTGQIVNLLAVLSLYPLAVKVGGSRWTGVVAVMVAGLLSPMPMYYVNWGRYVQLAGQVVLPTAMWLAWTMMESHERHLRVEILTGLTVAGLFLTHYRVSIYFALFLPLLWLVATLQAFRQKRQPSAPLVKALVIAMTAMLLVLPWVWNLFSGLLPKILGDFARLQTSAPAYDQAQVLRDTTRYVPLSLLIGALLGLVAGLVRRRGQALLLTIWVGLLFLAANPDWLGLPGAVTVSNFEGVLNSFTVLISLYIPVSILCGYLASTLLEMLPDRIAWLRPVVAAGLVLGLSLVGTRNALATLDTRFSLVATPDVQAMEWIEEQTPEDSRFLANSFFAYEENVIVGSDGGWWIPLLAHRQNTVPPITYGHETARDADYVTQVNELWRYVETNDLDDPDTIQLLKDKGITHVYIGQKGGSLPIEVLLDSDAYALVYHRDRVWIFSIQ